MFWQTKCCKSGFLLKCKIQLYVKFHFYNCALQYHLWFQEHRTQRPLYMASVLWHHNHLHVKTVYCSYFRTGLVEMSLSLMVFLFNTCITVFVWHGSRLPPVKGWGEGRFSRAPSLRFGPHQLSQLLEGSAAAVHVQLQGQRDLHQG